MKTSKQILKKIIIDNSLEILLPLLDYNFQSFINHNIFITDLKTSKMSELLKYEAEKFYPNFLYKIFEINNKKYIFVGMYFLKHEKEHTVLFYNLINFQDCLCIDLNDFKKRLNDFKIYE